MTYSNNRIQECKVLVAQLMNKGDYLTGGFQAMTCARRATPNQS